MDTLGHLRDLRDGATRQLQNDAILACQRAGEPVLCGSDRTGSPELIGTGDVKFAYLGVQTVDVTPAIAEANGLNATRGIVVVETVRNSSAEGVNRR